ncbi:MAG TPA: beta-ketoacyl-ACP synthase III [Bryobacteraceae bacterium]|nr:beta-ketoacyl-ACP synthase III [Bryobacteraceae bacterium]
MPRAKISAVGCYVPPDVLTNDDLSKIVDTNDKWIVERTGIRERHVAPPSMATSDMAVEAAKAALAERGMEAKDLDALIVCTVTPDMYFPATACLVQDRLGASGIWGFDLVAACSGFIYGLTTAAGLVMSGTHKRVMVIGADTMTRILDYTDRTTCILFGDGAGAMIIEATEKAGIGYIGHLNEIDGAGGQYLKMPAGGSRLPASAETVAARQHFVKQEGQQVFKYAVKKMYEMSECLLKRHGLTAQDVKLLIPHQANKRIIQATAERMGLSDEQVVLNIEKYGNTTAATIPLATRDALADGRLQQGDLVLFAAVGAGYTAGSALWRWAY